MARAAAFAANIATNWILFEGTATPGDPASANGVIRNGSDSLPGRYCGVIVATRVKGPPHSPFDGSPRQEKSKGGDAPHGDVAL
jgi:hypothetical protein